MIAQKKYWLYNECIMKPELFFRSHKKKIITGAPIIFLLLLGSSGVLASGNSLSLTTPNSLFVETNDEVPVTLMLNTRTPINAVGGTVVFSPELLSVLSLTRTSSIIDLWSEEPVVSNTEGTVRFSGGILADHVGTEGNHGAIFTLNMHALKAGKVSLRIKDGELLAHDGSGANQISSTGVLHIYIRATGAPSPDITNDGELSLMDVNSLYLKTFRAYEAKNDLNGDGVTDWADVKYLISLL